MFPKYRRSEASTVKHYRVNVLHESLRIAYYKDNFFKSKKSGEIRV